MRKRLPVAAIGYVRLSDIRTVDLDPDGTVPGLLDQERRVREHCERLGWTLAEILVEADVTKDGRVKGVSAYKRRQVETPGGRVELRVIRPMFREALDRLGDGRADGLVVLDLDRLLRQPRDLEDLIDLVERTKVPVVSVTGSLRGLTDPSDIQQARGNAAHNARSSADTARRVRHARQRQVTTGRYGGGRRPFGFEPDGKTVRPAEAGIIADLARRVIDGESLRGLAADLERRAVPTASGAAWSSSTVRTILLRERNAGRLQVRSLDDEGEPVTVVGTAPWPAIVEPDVHDEVVAILTDPGRTTTPGPTPRWLGSLLYLCGVCGEPNLTASQRHDGRPRYVCRARCLSRVAEPLDDFVNRVLIARLSQPDAIDLFAPVEPTATIDGASLRDELRRIGRKLTSLAEMHARDEVTDHQLTAATKVHRAREREIEMQLAASRKASPLAPLIGVDVAAVWPVLPLRVRRGILASVCTVTVLPGATGRKPFDPLTVAIGWKSA